MFDKVAEFCRVFCRVLASPEFLKFFGLAELLQNPSFSSMVCKIESLIWDTNHQKNDLQRQNWERIIDENPWATEEGKSVSDKK